MRTRCVIWLGASVMLLGLAACRSTTGPTFDPRKESSNVSSLTNLMSLETTNRLDPSWLQPPKETFTLGPGDRMEVEIMGEPQSRATVVVGPDGKIYYNILPGIDVWGLTLDQARDRLQREFGRLEVTPPSVGIILRNVESKRVWLLGRLQTAGVYPITSPMTLLEAVAMAGGTLSSPGSSDELADLRHSFIVRNGQPIPVDFQRLLQEGDMSQNVYVYPGDFIYVPSAKARDVYVLGAVRAPRTVNYSPDTTVVSVVASAGGTIKDAYLSHVAVVRGSLTEPKIAIVNYKDIVQGKAPDVRLEPQDIVYVPFTPYRTLTRYADLILTTFVRAVAINEGARAASDNAIPVGVNIGIGTP